MYLAFYQSTVYEKIAIRGDGKSPDQKVIDMQLQAANLVYIFDVIILSVTANKSGRLTVETSFLPLNSSKGGTLKCKPYKAIILKPNNTL